MITSNIISNTFFFAKSEQQASLRYTLYPFYTFSPVFYTSLYQFIPYRKTHKQAHSAFQPPHLTKYTPQTRFSDFIPSSMFRVHINFSVVPTATAANCIEKKKGLSYLKPSVKTGDLVRIQT